MTESGTIEKESPYRNPPSDKGFAGWGLAMFLLAIIGFWPSYFRPTIDHTFNSPVGMMPWHVLFTFLWLLMLFIQPLLIVLHQVRWHKYLGVFTLMVAVGLIYSGWMVQLQFMHHYATLGEHSHAVMVPFFRLITLLIFTVCLIMGLIIKDRNWHKRLMLLGSFAILEAAFARLYLNYFDLIELSGLYGVLTHVLIMLGFVVWDRMREGFFHPVSIWGSIMITAVVFGTAPLAGSSWWQSIATQMTTWVS